MKLSTPIITLGLLASSFLLQAQPSYPPAPPAAATIGAIEWFIDSDPGFGNGNPLPFAPSADVSSLAASISLAGVRPGIHRLFIRSRDDAGNWSITGSVTFENFHPGYAPPAPAPSAITELEVFFDKDPGFGNGFRQTVPAGTDIAGFSFSVGVDTLSPGTHQLFIRSFSNPWSLSEIRTFSNNTPLPLGWLYVRAELAGDGSLISWSTAQESNTLQFEIERSADGLAFSTIGSVGAAGNSSTPLEYKWTDVAPAPGMNYYRIRQTDRDGKSSYSGVVTVLYRTGLTKTVVAPNPAASSVLLLFARPAESSVMNIYDAAGRLVLSGKIEKGVLQQRVDLRSLPSGMYMMQIAHDRESETLRILKK